MMLRGVLNAARTLAYSSLIIGAGAAAQVWLYFRETDNPINVQLIVMVGLATIAVYTLQRAVRFRGQIPEMVSERHHWMDRNRKPLLVLALVAGVLSALLAIDLFTSDWLVFLPFGIITVLYTMPLPGIGTKRYGLRELPYIKIIFIAITWVAATVLLPDVQFSSYYHGASWLLAAEQGLLIFAITVPFDVRDMLRDDAARKTIPQVLGISVARRIALVALVLSFVCLVLFGRSDLPLMAGMAITYFGAALLIAKAHPDKHELYYTCAIDGLLVLGPLLVWVLDQLI